MRIEKINKKEKKKNGEDEIRFLAVPESAASFLTSFAPSSDAQMQLDEFD